MTATQVLHGLDIEAVLRPSRWASGKQVIGAIPEHVAEQLPLAWNARKVWLHQHTILHICAQRNLTASDTEFVFEYMSAAVLHPMFCGVERKCDRVRISLVNFIRPERRYLYLGAKVTRREHEDEEIWVSTAYPVNEETLRRYLRSGRLQGVVGTKLEGGKTRTARRIPIGLATQMP